MKKVIIFTLTLMLLLSAFATVGVAGKFVPTAAVSGSVFDITHPSTVTSTTTQSSFTISGVAVKGSVISFSIYKGGSYVSVGTQVVGASGYFAQRVTLSEGKNNVRVTGYSPSGQSQISDLVINLVVETVWDKIKNTPIDFGNEINQIFK